VIANDVSGPNFPNKSAFQIFSMDVTRTGSNLSVSINTNYVNGSHIGFLGTGLGALFIGAGTPTYNRNGDFGNNVGSSSDNYRYDTFRNDPGRFDYAVQINGSITPSGTSGDATLYSLTNPLSNVQQSWHGSTSTIDGTSFRAGQAVGVKDGTPVTSATAAKWSVTKGTDGKDGVGDGGGALIFDITGFFDLIPSLGVGDMTLAWAMTCGNDVIVATVSFPPDAPTPTPLPASLPLFASGLGALGLITWRRKRKGVAVNAA
jgi:hypothetical protein